MLPAALIIGVMIVLMQAMASQLDSDVLEFVSIAGSGLAGLITLLFIAYMAGGFVNLALKASRGQQTGFGDLFSGGRFLGRFIVLWIVGGLVIGIGLALCLVPGYILSFGLSLAPFLIVDQDLSGVDALKRSWEMTKGHKVTIFLFNLLGSLIYMVAGTCALGLFVAIPMQVVGSAYIYLRIKGENPQAPT